MHGKRICEIENNTKAPLRVDLEPLTLSETLAVGASLYVEPLRENASFVVRIGTDEKNELCLSIWPDEGHMIGIFDASGKSFFDE